MPLLTELDLFVKTPTFRNTPYNYDYDEGYKHNRLNLLSKRTAAAFAYTFRTWSITNLPIIAVGKCAF